MVDEAALNVAVHMSLESQIQLITVPQEFVRLCNAVFAAEHGADYLPIDDDRPDRGNDGFLTTQNRMFAMHCFKRVQNQSIDAEIRRKMASDLRKAHDVRREGRWSVDRWTFVSNYPVSESLAAEIVGLGRTFGIDVSWTGPEDLARLFRKHDLGDAFPQLNALQLARQLDEMARILEGIDQRTKAATTRKHSRQPALPDDPDPEAGANDAIPTLERLAKSRPGGWEYMLYARALERSIDRLDRKWQTHGLEVARGRPRAIAEGDAIGWLARHLGAASSALEALNRTFDEGAQADAFGEPGEPGNEERIVALANEAGLTYETFLDWADAIRAAQPPEEFWPLYDAAANLCDGPIRQLRAFAADLLDAVARIPAHLARVAAGSDEKLELTVTLLVELDAEAQTALSTELELQRERLLG